jgi:hypothetical protein
MFDKFLNIFKSEPITKKQTIINKLLATLETAKNSDGFICFISYLYKEDGEDRLRHNIFKGNFKDEDLLITLDEYQKSVKNSIQIQSKSVENDQSEEKERFKVEE